MTQQNTPPQKPPEHRGGPGQHRPSRSERRRENRRANRRSSRPPEDFPVPPKVGRSGGLAPDSKDAPENVRDGVRAWYIVAAIQAVTAVLQLIMTLQDRRALTSQVRDQMDNMSLADGITEDTLVTGTAITNLLFMLAAVAVCTYLTSRVARGAVRSRMFLMIGSVYLALMALLQVFSSPPDAGATVLVLAIGAGTIISGVIAVVGLWLVTRPDNADWFGLPDKAEVEAYTEKVAKRNEELDKERAKKKEEKAERKRAREREKEERRQDDQGRGR
ncbi:MAG: hypothetical protein ACTH1D_01090 [Mycobacteriaceae bacterium]|uniref:hypothetical protein n=1 Tax=Corynebacterium sp. TaxID=1720 RepID=UPI003F981BB5